MQKRKSKIGNIILLVGVLGLLMFGVILYATIKTKTSSLNKVAPFDKLIGQTVRLNREAYLMQEIPARNDDYPFVLMDPEHENFQWYIDRTVIDPPETVILDTIPAGTPITFEKAIVYTNGVSGHSTPCIFGRLVINGKDYRVEYSWGKLDLAKWFDQEKKSWKFWRAPWQEAPDTTYYEIPAAQWW